MRVFQGGSVLAQDRLALALAPALTPGGLVASPWFFSGFAVYPQVLARGLVTLADVTATRYFQFRPQALRDPVLTAQGDRLRAECFSACNSVYARLDLLDAGLDGGEIGHGTTNVDLGSELRAALSRVGREQLLHLAVGREGLTISRLEETVAERPVQMPDRWVRALGNAAELHHGLAPAFRVGAAPARAFIATLPAATGQARSGWLTWTPTGVELAARRTAGAVFVAGSHRLSAVKRLLVNVEGLTVYGPEGGDPGPALVEFSLPVARLWLGLTEEAWRGHSGEGALLASLAGPTVVEDADLVSALLAFEPVIDVPRLARQAGLPEARVAAALAVLAASGRVGWDAHDAAHFHRELPDDPDRVAKDNPRLVAAQKLVDAVVRLSPGEWAAPSGEGDHHVHYDPAEGLGQARCTCAWYLRHLAGRGPCKHMLAVRLKERT
ncbi:MAG: SWIM zinc finger domain-containing protein [Propionibacteriaceae bacterium]|jgi:hypothetical protein|nr:SWIM zinc finger domain-containing protein [Propionibacteriaceae bacterium]